MIFIVMKMLLINAINGIINSLTRCITLMKCFSDLITNVMFLHAADKFMYYFYHPSSFGVCHDLFTSPLILYPFLIHDHPLGYHNDLFKGV